MTDVSGPQPDLTRALAGDTSALSSMLEAYRERLRRMITLRMDPHLQQRIDASDVLQEAYLDVYNRIGEYDQQSMPFFLWVRLITAQKLVDARRFHFGAQKRSLNREQQPRFMLQASTDSLALQLVGSISTASRIAMRGELVERVRQALLSMDEIDREVLTLRHFEQLSNHEAAQVLGIHASAASNRYVRALRRLKEVISADSMISDNPIQLDGDQGESS